MRKKKQKDMSCSIPLGSGSGVALLPFIHRDDSHLSLSLLSSGAQLAVSPEALVLSVAGGCRMSVGGWQQSQAPR